MNRRLYVLTRSNLSLGQQAVQSGHAVAEWMKTHGNQRWANEYLIYLAVEDEQQLNNWAFKLKRRDIEYVEFREPDLDNAVTAIAAVSDGRVFAHLPLLFDTVLV